MKAFILLGALLFNAQAHAADFINFTFFGNEGRNRIYLSCYYAENAVDQILNELGATDIDVRCSGGIDFGRAFPVTIQAKYTLPADARTVEINSDFNTNCYFDTRFIERLVSGNDRLEKVSGSRSCFRSDSRYGYKLEIK